MSGWKTRLDDLQSRSEPLAVAFGTLKKYGEDSTANLAATIAFWAFFSIFPLMLVAVTVLGYVLPDDTKEEVLGEIAGLFPLLDVDTVGALGGSWWALLLGVATALWSGTGVIRTVQFALDSIWEVPRRDRPGVVSQALRSVVLLATIGLGFVVAVVASSLVTGSTEEFDIGWLGRGLGLGLTLVLDVVLFVVAFRVLTSRDVSTRTVLPGAILAGLAFFVLQHLSTLLIGRYIENADETYGRFATVITILWWFLLQAQLTLLGAQLNVVLERRLWPRGFAQTTDADRRALQAHAAAQTFEDDQVVESRVP